MKNVYAWVIIAAMVLSIIGMCTLIYDMAVLIHGF